MFAFLVEFSFFKKFDNTISWWKIWKCHIKIFQNICTNELNSNFMQYISLL